MPNLTYTLIRICLIFSLLLVGKPTYADASINLYSATIPIANQSNQAQAATFGIALGNVLIKVSGNPAIISAPVIVAAIKQAPQWVQSYNYTSTDNLQITVQFNQDQINQLLAQAKQTIWSGARPQTLVWLVVNQNNQSQLIGNNSNSPLPELIQDDAAGRGFTVVFPLIDLQDLSLVNVQSIVQYQPDVIRQASVRYPHDDILLATISAPVNSNNNWQVHWTLLLNGAKVDWQTQATDEKTAISQGMDQFANTIFTQHQTQVAAQPQNNNGITLTVYGINSSQDYSMVNRYLQQLAAIQSITLATVASDHVVFTLTLNSSVQALNDALVAGNKLIATDSNSENSLVYRVSS